jgi:hypothetical protein
MRIPLALALLAAALPAAAQTTIDDIQGRWQTGLTEQPAPDGTAYIRQTIAFTATRETYRVEAYADAEGTAPLFTYASEGPYDVVGGYEAMDGALALDLQNETSKLTIHVDAPELWAALNLAACPLAVGKAVEITGCVAGPPFAVTDCVDLDLTLVDEGGTRLRMGEGGTDRCNERPQEASATPFSRVD